MDAAEAIVVPAPPSKKRLAIATAVALAVATMILFCAVLPAEYGIDPLGTGRAMGLTAMHAPLNAKDEPVLPAGAAVKPTQVGAVAFYPADYKTDSAEFTLGPYEYVEYKYDLEKGAALLYSWTATAPVIQDFHGEAAGSNGKNPQSYDKGEKRHATGSFVAPFAGIHGWYWENPGAETITVRVTSAGFYRGALEFRFDGTKKTHPIGPLNSPTANTSAANRRTER